MIRLVIAEDTYLVREGIRRLLEPEADIEVVAACEDLSSLLDAIESEQPDVVLTDIRMPPTSQTRASRPPIAFARRTRNRGGRPEPVRRARVRTRIARKGADRRAYLLSDRSETRRSWRAANREVAGGVPSSTQRSWKL
jgi:DNA-binding NarL/FixJ family response regulator